MSDKVIEFFIDGKQVAAKPGQTVIQAARDNGFEIPHYCWHPNLSVPGNCRICLVEVESDKGDSWFDISCNMPVTAGMRVLLNSDLVKHLRKDMMQFLTLNHPVDCAICSKAGECLLQDYHYEHNGASSLSRDPKTHATKFFPLSERIMLDNERCILCTRCVRFTHEISGSRALAMVNRADHSLIRPAEDANFNNDVYSDNVIDICPVGALLARKDLDNSRVWFTEPTPSVCPGCSRGCNIDIWHRKKAWMLNAVTPGINSLIERVTPRDNPDVNGPWVCNKARDLAEILERPRAAEPMRLGASSARDEVVAAVADMLESATSVVALVSSWGSNEELKAFRDCLAHLDATRVTAWVKSDMQAMPGETVEDDLLIKADKNPNRRGALEHFEELPDNDFARIPADADVILVWGEGVPSSVLPQSARVIRFDAWQNPDNSAADAFVPITIQTERSGHYTNFEGRISAFTQCFEPPPHATHAEVLFGLLSDALSRTGAAR